MLYPRISLYALMLAAAGIPLYIHLPQFATTELGISLGVLGAILLGIRVIDLVQDPLLGWAIDRWPQAQLVFAILAALGLAIGFPLLFSLRAEADVVPKLISVLVLLFSAYSLGMILLYGRSATLAKTPDAQSLMTVAAYREVGMLAGVILAALAPTLFVAMGASAQGYPALGLFLGSLALVALVVTIPIWRRRPITGEKLSLSNFTSAGAMRLLILALFNSLPVAITSTLFLFFVDDRLQLPGKAGVLLILFFFCAGLSVPLWAKISRRVGARATLLVSMPLSILAFVGAAFMPAGDLIGFALVCIASGAALGADMVVLPAMFSVALTRAGLNASSAFGIWSFASKLGLALAAFTVLPYLERNGYTPGQSNSASALSSLNFAYAILPCLLKLCAFSMVLALPKSEQSQ
ncbi:melibiose:sodium symporter [Roseovarius albus]|uniref:Melibiose:sodium symporter n=1 Tax=Roseovarius albus TaxID=1247867 RepID=A0A1X7A730_9RHOB|nr:MFS transporter [Roseovarius albus]SLN71908.1 melibiose:sodium symporter [Roseovarius albus]